MSALRLDINLKQTLKLSPQQIQVMKLLEIPSVDLAQRIDEELQENPALEEGLDDTEIKDENENASENEDEEYVDLEAEEEMYQNPLDSDDYRDFAADPNGDERQDWHETNYTGGQSLYEYLKSQVYLTKMTKPERHIAKWILGNIDEDGYLRRTTEQLADDYAFQEGEVIEDSKIEWIVDQIKGFDPAGVGAKDLQECLMLQLKRKGHERAINNAIRVVHIAWDDFSQRRYEKVQERLEMTPEELRDALEVITHLNQKPANAFDGNTREERQRQSVIPDFLVENHDGELIMILNKGHIPPLHISAEYKQMEQDYAKDKEAVRFIRQKIEAAGSFIDAIRQRNETLYAVMKTILQMQHDFFIEGDDTALRPMILQDVADRTGYDVSTISRVSNSKFVQTEFGVFPLRHFFSEGIANSDGDEISTREIKQIMSELVDHEDKINPLNDDRLMEELANHGYPIARRTVAKYREQLGIPVARLRREI